MAKLEEIDVERVDGVDEPATRQKFLILKAEEPDEAWQNLKTLAEKVEAALAALEKADPPLDERTADALNEVSKMLGLKTEFKAKKPKKPEEEYGYPEQEKAKKPKKPEDEYGYPEPEKTKKAVEVNVAAPEIDIETLAKAVAEHLVSLEKGTAQSRQVPGQDALVKSAKKLGDGLFTNIIFGGK